MAKKYSVSEQTIYVWKKRFGGFDVVDAKRLKLLEAENGQLKKLPEPCCTACIKLPVSDGEREVLERNELLDVRSALAH